MEKENEEFLKRMLDSLEDSDFDTTPFLEELQIRLLISLFYKNAKL